MKTLGISTLFLLTFICSIEGAKFLLLFMQFSGHISEFGAAAEGLLENGHEVHLVVDENLLQGFQKRLAGTKAQFLTYKSPDKDFVSDKTADKKLGTLALSGAGMSEILKGYFQARITHDCKLTLQDKDLFKKMQEIKFDMAIVDGMYFCYHVIPHKLGIPYISLATPENPLLLRVHPLVGHMSCNIAGTRNTFINRIKQFIMTVMSYTRHKAFCDETQFPASKYSPDRPYSSFRELAEKSKLWLIAQDNAIDCPRPVNPNIVLVGGISTRPAKPLTGTFHKIAEKAKEGFILVSFGSMVTTMPKEMQEKFVNAFRRVKQVVIWRTDKVEVVLPKNVHAVKWMPQNDLLGHLNIRLFITHCGNNGNSESVYHGVPMLAMPLLGDQAPNADRVEFLGYGRRLSITKFTSDQLYETMESILNTPGYTAKIKKASEILKSKVRHPRQEAAYWIEHVLKFGNHHLRTPLTDMNLIEFLMLDIYLAVLTIFLILYFIVKKIVLYVLGKYCVAPKMKSGKKPKAE